MLKAIERFALLFFVTGMSTRTAVFGTHWPNPRANSMLLCILRVHDRQQPKLNRKTKTNLKLNVTQFEKLNVNLINMTRNTGHARPTYRTACNLEYRPLNR